jgi:hypothetical protein
MTLTQADLKAILSYDPEAGTFRRLNTGKLTGHVQKQGYAVIQIMRKRHKRSRLAWLYMTGEWPAAMVDHRNGDRSDDRWSNLRAAAHGQNQRNSRGRRPDCLKGAFWHKRDQRWRAQIYLNSRPIHLGYFDSEEEAHAAYCEAAKKYHGDFARTA